MLTLYKALLVVLVFALLVFALARPAFLRFMSPADYAIRRNLWLALTVAAFLIPSFWVFMLVAAAFVWFAASRDSNPTALYMMLLITLPPLGMDLPTFGLVNQLFALNHLRFASLALLLPLALGIFRRESGEPYAVSGPRLLRTDFLILLYALLQTVLLMPGESVTATGKRVVLMGIDMLLPYYVLSRACSSRESFRELMAAFVLGAVLVAPMSVFEMFKGWLLYAGLEEYWGTVPFLSHITRGNYLRAQVNAGHPIVLGFTFAVAFGFWLALRSSVEGGALKLGILLALLVGLVTTFSRGPWVGAVVIWVIFLSLGPDARRRLAQALGLLLAVGAVGLISPWSDKIIDYIPFIGNVGSETVAYRMRLAETSWQLVLQNPIFGSPNYLAYMEKLRQGEGIIDLVNAYATIALSFGLVGLGLFAAFFGSIILRCMKAALPLIELDPEFNLVGAALVATLVATLAMLFTVNLYMSIGALAWILGGMGVAYSRLAKAALPLDTGVWTGPELAPMRMSSQQSRLRGTVQ
jgi:hypothetical protein